MLAMNRHFQETLCVQRPAWVMKGIALLAIVLAAGWGETLHARQEDAHVAEWEKEILPLVQTWCLDCHSGDSADGNLNLEIYATAQAAAQQKKVWRKIANRVRDRQMPPHDGPEMPGEDRTRLVDWIDQTLEAIPGRFSHHAGPVTVRRLSRHEYQNTIRDLFGIQIDREKLFPVDETGYGFDNVGDVLTVSPLLLEKYLHAAETIAADLVPDPRAIQVDLTVSASHMNGVEGSHLRDGSLILSTRGTVAVPVAIHRAGKYRLTIEAWGQQAGDEKCRLGVAVDGKPLEEFEVSTGRDEPGTFALTAELEKGDRSVQLSFLNDYYNPQAADRSQRDRNMALDSFRIEGPVEKTPPQPSQSRFLFVQPSAELPARDAAARIVKRFAPRAWRRRVNEEEIASLLKLFDQATAEGESFEGALQWVVQGLLVSPHFLYKCETSPPADGSRVALDGFELATAVSYFLWGSMPDDELFRVAASGQLQDEVVLRAQVQRMIAHQRSLYLVRGFAGQWLHLPLLDEVDPDPALFSSFSPELRQAMMRETELQLNDVFRKGEPLASLFITDETYVNRALAKFYGLPLKGLRDQEFRRVSTGDSGRGGLLTQASILTLTSNPSRTSPVKRGKWVLGNLLGDPPPPPQPDVPQLDSQHELSGSLRERMEQHRADPNCAVCHTKMDAIGFALENYDATGRYRTEDEGHVIDASGELPDGRRFSGARELQSLMIREYRKPLTRCLVEKLFIFGVGRSPSEPDDVIIDRITGQAIENEWAVPRILEELILSEPFRYRATTSAMPAAFAAPSPPAAEAPSEKH